MRERSLGFVVVLTICLVGGSSVLAVTGYSVNSDGDGQLYAIDLNTGVAAPIGPVGFSDVEGLSFHPVTGVLYGVDDITEQLITINLATGAGTPVGALGVGIVDMGLTFDAAGNLWMATDVPATFYSINPATGAAAAVGPQGQFVTGLAASGHTVYGLGGDFVNNLVTINTATGATTPVGALGAGLNVTDGGIDFDNAGVLWGIEDGGNIFTINPVTGAGTVISGTLSGFESLAIQQTVIPEPATLVLLGLSAVGFVLRRRRR